MRKESVRDGTKAAGKQPHDVRGRHLHLDCLSGMAGDMFLGAMLDLGVPMGAIQEVLECLPLRGYELVSSRRAHHGIDGCDVQVRVVEAGSTHRRYSEIREMLKEAELPEQVGALSMEIFERLARAEAKVHAVELDAVTFHEVGDVDSIIDVVGAATAIAYLCPKRISSRPIPLGSGTMPSAHGMIPIPAPATLEILRGLPVEDGGAAQELCTPTGAAIIAVLVDEFGPLPGGRICGVGYGAGDRELDDRPNHLRAVLLDATAPGGGDDDRAVVVGANVDDMNPEYCSHLMERLFDVGAYDVWYTPILMKKGRPAITISVLCARAAREAVSTVLLSESTTIGLRFHPVDRKTLAHQWVTVETPYGSQRIKEAREGQRVVNAAPEFDGCAEAAKRLSVPLKEVYAAALAAYYRLPQGGR